MTFSFAAVLRFVIILCTATGFPQFVVGVPPSSGTLRGIPTSFTFPSVAEIRSSKQRCLCQFASSENHDDADNTPTGIDQYVGGLHGGKYQFNEGSMSSLSFAGQQFAEELASSSLSSSSVSDQDEEESRPHWASRMEPPRKELGRDKEYAIIDLRQGGDAVHVTIKNEYRTWEKYYAKVVQRTQQNSENVRNGGDEELLSPLPRFQAVPCTGILAPCGGADNLCDSENPYTDSAQVTVRAFDDVKLSQTRKRGGADEEDDWWLLIGTEEEKWYFRLKKS